MNRADITIPTRPNRNIETFNNNDNDDGEKIGVSFKYLCSKRSVLRIILIVFM